MKENNNMKRYLTFTDAYYDLLQQTYYTPEYICSPRGQKVYEKLCVSFTIEKPLARLPHLKARNFSVSYAIAEALYYLSGNDNVDWISYYSPFWKNITDDGSTVNSAYGARIFKPHPRAGQRFSCLSDKHNKLIIGNDPDDTWTQWQYIIDELEYDNDSRRAVIHLRNPLDSRYAKKDIPCTMTLQFLLRDDNLNLIVSMRSSDCWLGIANDVPAFTLFQELMATELSHKLQRNINVGTYMHVSNSLHIYERNFEVVRDLLSKGKPEICPYYDDFSPKKEFVMPRMPGTPPIEQLLFFERQVRNSESTSSLQDVLSNALKWSYDEYWKDWMRILASNRAGKLSNKHLQVSLLQSTTWKGYHFFER